MSLIAIIIPVRNRKKYTQQILSQLSAQMYQSKTNNIAVVVVDDGSTDGTPEIIRNQFPDVHLIQGDGNLWWTGAISAGMKYAIDKLDSKYLVWLNDDISLGQDFIVKLFKICHSPVSGNAVIGGIVRDQTYPDWIVFSGMVNKKLIRSLDDFATAEAMEVDTLNGNITIIPRPVIDKIGFPDADRFRHYGGDFEFVLRAKESGFKVILSMSLEATTDYQITDFIRYMPPWMQWYIESNFSQRQEIIKGFTNLKSHYNIWHMVNINYCGRCFIPPWKYGVFYIRQILKLFISNFWSQSQIQMKIDDYFQEQNVPTGMAEAVMNRRSS